MENKHLIEVTEAGMGRLQNPHTNIYKFNQFEHNVECLPAFQQDGKTPLEPGRYEVELVKRYWYAIGLTGEYKWYDKSPIPIDTGIVKTQTIYRSLSPAIGEVEDVKAHYITITIEGKSLQLDKRFIADTLKNVVVNRPTVIIDTRIGDSIEKAKHLKTFNGVVIVIKD